MAAAAEKAALQARFDAWPKVVSAAEAAQPVASVAKFRAQIWERIKLRSPPLSFAEEARWPQVRDDWAKMQPKIHTIAGVACHAVIELVNKVLERLGSYYTGVSNGNKGDATGGDPEALAKLFRKIGEAGAQIYLIGDLVKAGPLVHGLGRRHRLVSSGLRPNFHARHPFDHWPSV